MSGAQRRQSRVPLKLLLGGILLVGCYVALIVPFTGYMRDKPFVEKIGHVPKAEFLQAVSGDQKQLVAEALVLKVLMYFGGLVEEEGAELRIPPDYQAMSRLLHGAVKLDPYNMDAYYFAQSILVWDVKQIKLANALLETGMKYRSWDWYLPFFAGFNNAYFLKDYPAAAKHYMRAAELTGNDLFVTLAGRYLNEAGQNDLAIAYLDTMAKSAKSQAIRDTLTRRLKALEGVRVIEQARDSFKQRSGRLPSSVQELLQSGDLSAIPADPYGGSFYLEPDGKVRTTSNFASPQKKAQNQEQKK